MRKGHLELTIQVGWYDNPAMNAKTLYLFFLRPPTDIIYSGNLGIQKVDASLKDQLVFIEGTAPPSSIVSAIQDTGRDAILRGSGTTNSMRSPYTLTPIDTLYLC